MLRRGCVHLRVLLVVVLLLLAVSAVQAPSSLPLEPQSNTFPAGVLVPNDPSATQHNAAVLAALSNTSTALSVTQPGRYAVANPVTVRVFAGTLRFCANATLVADNNTASVLLFQGGAGFRVEGLHVAFAVQPSRRVGSHEAVAVYNTSDTLFRNTLIVGSAAAGLLHCGCLRPRVEDVTVQDSMADGVHFCNCGDVRVRGVVTLNTGDDGLAFVNYGSRADLGGGVASDVIVRNSCARGVSVIGQRQVALTNIVVENTAHPGIRIAHESSYNTRVPTDVTVVGARILNGGGWNCSATALFANTSNCARCVVAGQRDVGSFSDFYCFALLSWSLFLARAHAHASVITQSLNLHSLSLARIYFSHTHTLALSPLSFAIYLSSSFSPSLPLLPIRH